MVNEIQGLIVIWPSIPISRKFALTDAQRVILPLCFDTGKTDWSARSFLYQFG